MAQIHKETDYNKFKMMAGNRGVVLSHVARLKNEMLKDAELLEAAPILVNENLFIIDGQHRYEAARQLGLPIYYIIKNGVSISTARRMNVTQRGWTIMDFAQSYAEGGNKNYQQFITMTKKFPHLSQSIIIFYMQGGEISGGTENFRSGGFVIDDIGEALQYLEQLDVVRLKTQTPINKPMASALFRLFKNADEKIDFEWEKLDHKLNNEHAVKLFATRSTVKDCLRSIEEVYGFMNPTRPRLY
jgi:hypothetical protein